MKFFNMLAALSWILDANPHGAFEVIADRPDENGDMPQVPIFPELSASDAGWIEANIVDVGLTTDLFRVSLDGEVEAGAIYVFYNDQGDIVRIFATRNTHGG